MGVSSSIDITEEQRETILTLLQRHLPDTAACAYGSRVKWTSRPQSDLDLVVFASPEHSLQVGKLREAFEESDLPFRVDLFVWDEVPETFREEIVENHADLVSTSRMWTTSNWRHMTFSQAVQINPKVRLDRNRTYPFVEMSAVNPGSRSVQAKEERPFKSGGSRFQDKDTLMARITPCLENGKIARYRAEKPMSAAFGSTEFTVIRGRPEVTDNLFAYYLTQWNKVRNFAIDQMTGSSGRQRVPTESLDHLVIPLPPLPEQRAIAHILGTLDDKIELNRQMNETLEAMARAIFKDWFVDFGPTRAKAEGRPPYLAPEFWDLFSDALDDQDKPIGWTLAPLSALAKMNPESWSRKNTPEEILYVDLANTKRGSIEATQRFLWKDSPSRAKRILRPGDTIVGLVRPGNCSFAFISVPGLTGSTGFGVLRPRKSKYAEFVFLAATAPDNIERLAHLADGAAYPAVSPEAVEATEAAIADNAVTSSFSALVAPIIDCMERNKTENQTLAQSRDLLLPKLMSGEIRLPQAEKIVEDAI